MRNRMVKSTWVAIIVIMFSMGLLGQVNTENYRPQGAEDGWNTNIDLGLALSKGNVDILAFDVDMGVFYQKGKSQYLAKGTLKYSEKNDASFINRGFVHLRGIREFNHRWEGEIFAQQEFDKFILLNSRTLAGLGIRYKITKTEKVSMFFGTGLMWEGENYSTDREGVKRAESSLLKSTNYLSFNFNSKDKFSFGLVTYGQFDVKHLDSFRILSELEFKIKLNAFLNYLTKVSYRFDNDPPATIKKYDIRITNGLSISF